MTKQNVERREAALTFLKRAVVLLENNASDINHIDGLVNNGQKELASAVETEYTNATTYYVANCQATQYHIIKANSPSGALSKFIKREPIVKGRVVLFNIKSRRTWTYKIDLNGVNVKCRGTLGKATAGWMQEGLPPSYVCDWTDLKNTDVRYM